jgi:hypothetical protein
VTPPTNLGNATGLTPTLDGSRSVNVKYHNMSFRESDYNVCVLPPFINQNILLIYVAYGSGDRYLNVSTIYE